MNTMSSAWQRLKPIWTPLVVGLFLLAVIAIGVDCFIRPLGVTAHLLYILSFLAYLFSEKVEGRQLLASEKAFSYSIIGAIGFFIVVHFSRSPENQGRGFLWRLAYTGLAVPWILWLAWRFSRQASDGVSQIKVWTYSLFFGGGLFLASLLEWLIRMGAIQGFLGSP